MKLVVPCLLLLTLFCCRAYSLSCGDCNHDNITDSCGPPPSCGDTVLDACGCCPLCAKLKGESCGGPWDSLGTCGQGLVCHPVATQAPVLGAGGIYSESWDPAGICVDLQEYQREHRRCQQLLLAYAHYQKSRGRRHAVPSPTMTSAADTDDVTTTSPVPAEKEREQTTVQTDSTVSGTGQTDSTGSGTGQAGMDTTTVSCLRKPSCTPDGYFTPLQCDGCAGECWCSSHDGQEINGTRGPYRTVRC